MRIILRSPSESLAQAGTRVTDLSNSVTFERGTEAFDELRDLGLGIGDEGGRGTGSFQCSVFSFQHEPEH